MRRWVLNCVVMLAVPVMVVSALAGVARGAPVAARDGFACGKPGPKVCYDPFQIGRAYGFNGLPGSIDGSGTTLGVIQVGRAPSVQSDMNAYTSYFKLPPLQLHLMFPFGKTSYDPSSDRDLAQATDEDSFLQLFHGLAPGAEVFDLSLPQDGLTSHLDQALNAIQSKKPEAVVFLGDPCLTEIQLENFPAITLNDITFFSSSGYTGKQEDCPKDTFALSESPLITAVGGTELHMNFDKKRSTFTTYNVENVWHDGSEISGFHLSHIFNRPSWQDKTPHEKGRATADVAADASASTGSLFIFNSSWYVAGGDTELGPWTALDLDAVQKVGKGLGNIHPFLYRFGNAKENFYFHDDTKGSSDGEPADEGWDPPTGLGSPNVPHIWHGLQEVM